jgi:predicted membrane channel-forming protein YqfA (hemolysin III family)
MKTFFDFLYHLVGLMAGTGGLIAFIVGLIVTWDKNHYLAVSIFLVAVISALVITIFSKQP